MNSKREWLQAVITLQELAGAGNKYWQIGFSFPDSWMRRD